MKKLFQGIKMDMKFKAAGSGQRLNEERRENPDCVAKGVPRPSKPPQDEAQIAAASAAIARLETVHRKSNLEFKNAVQINEIQHLEAHHEQNVMPSCTNVPAPEKESRFACNVLFKCPLSGEIIKKEDKEFHIRNLIEMLMHTDPLSASIMTIYTLNKNQDKVKVGVETITKYLNNIIDNPNEEKYRAVRLSNKVFQEKVNCLKGSVEFFEAIGFEKKMLPLPGQDEQDEFYVLSNEAIDDLQRYRDLLLSGKPTRVTLERQPRIFAPSRQAAKFIITDDFYNLTVEEIKREHQLRKEKLEQGSNLRTKAMREREEKLKMKKYAYTALRVRFPDGYLLQGTFYTRECLSTLFDFVSQHLQNNWLPYELFGPCGQKFENKQSTFYDYGLVPSALVTFCWDAEVLADVEAADGHKAENALRPELISTAETLD